MVRDEKFSIISVNADDDEELVIRAGIPQAFASREDEGGDKTTKSELVTSVTFETVSETVHETKATKEVGSELKTQPKKKHMAVGVAQRGAEARYITTREDLEDEGPFKKMRLVILLGAILLVAAFIV